MKFLIAFTISLCSFGSFGQKMDSDYFEEGIFYFESGDFEKAAECFLYISINHTKSDYYERSIYNLALTYKSNNQPRNAINTFLFMLNSEAEDSEYIGGNIMSNPFANYKHNSASIISSIYKDLGEYDSALVYFSYADTMYPLQSTCGNEYQENAVYQALNYADLHLKLNNKPEAIRSLLAGVWSYYSENQQVIDSLQPLLINEKNVLRKFDRALKKMTIKKSDRLYSYVIKFRENTMVVPSGIVNNDDCNRKEAIEAVKKTRFYQMMSRL